MIVPEKYVARFPKSMDRDRRLHLAMVAAVDDFIGLAMGALKKKGLLENTVVFFQSDNGATQETRADHAGRPYRGGSNAPFRGWKEGLFEGGVRMPAMMSWPAKIKSRKVVEGIGMAMDVMPTFLSMAGLSAPTGMDGRDQSGMILGEGKSAHEEVHWLYHDSRAVRKGAWKLIENPPRYPEDPLGQPAEKYWLTNLEQDPGERRNWAGESPAMLAELMKLLPENN